MIWKILLVAVLVIVAFVAWRYTSVARGVKARDGALLAVLDPILAQLECGSVPMESIKSLAEKPELRSMLYAMLEHYKQLDAFPEHLTSESAQAQSALAYWALHPNELQVVPVEMQVVEVIARGLEGRSGNFYVLRYRMPEGHWAGTQWLLGLAGPFYPGQQPYGEGPGAFARGDDTDGKVSPSELVDWYLGVLKEKRVDT